MQPLMPKATAVWLIDNTTLTFDQISEFVGLHPLEVSGIADGEVAVGIKGFDPVANNQLTRSEIERCENDPQARLKLASAVDAPTPKKKAPRYTPLSKRQDRPAAIAWLVRNHPELASSQICKLLGTTKQTIEAIKTKKHWNSANIQPVDPVALGLCRQVDLDEAVRIAAEKAAKLGETLPQPEPSPSLMSTEDSLRMELGDDALDDDPHRSDGALAAEDVFDTSPSAAPDDDDTSDDAPIDPDALFTLPKSDAGDGMADEASSEDDGARDGR